jgi:hypothetical protein
LVFCGAGQPLGITTTMSEGLRKLVTPAV